MGGWGYSESPLIDGDKLLCTPGGKKATLAALDKKTGETIWMAPIKDGNQAAYSSIVAADVAGQRQYIQFLAGGVVGVTAEGKFLWRYNKPSAGINCTTPIYHDQCVYAAASYGKGGGMVQLIREDNQVKAEEKYFHKNMENHHGGLVLIDGYLYGEGSGRLACMEFKTGKEMWREGKAGKGSIAYADGRLYYRNEGGPIILAEANPEKYVEHGRFKQPKRSGKSLAAPRHCQRQTVHTRSAISVLLRRETEVNRKRVSPRITRTPIKDKSERNWLISFCFLFVFLRVLSVAAHSAPFFSGTLAGGSCGRQQRQRLHTNAGTPPRSCASRRTQRR